MIDPIIIDFVYNNSQLSLYDREGNLLGKLIGYSLSEVKPQIIILASSLPNFRFIKAKLSLIKVIYGPLKLTTNIEVYNPIALNGIAFDPKVIICDISRCYFSNKTPIIDHIK